MYGILWICFDINLERKRAIGIEIIEDKKIVARIIDSCEFNSCVICEIVNAAPVRDF